jgi:hypothetical protein
MILASNQELPRFKVLQPAGLLMLVNGYLPIRLPVEDWQK